MLRTERKVSTVMLAIKNWTGKMYALLLNGIDKLMTTDIPEVRLRIPEISLPQPSPRRVPRLYAPIFKDNQEKLHRKKLQGNQFFFDPRESHEASLLWTHFWHRKKKNVIGNSRGLLRVNSVRTTWLSSVIRPDLWMKGEQQMSFTSTSAKFLTLSHTIILFPR